MRILIAAVAMVMLAGCASTESLLGGEPSSSYKTSKTPQQYAKCVVPKWQSARRGVSSFETETGYRVVAEYEWNTDEVLDIASVKTGASVRHYQRADWAAMPGRSAIESAVRSCL